MAQHPPRNVRTARNVLTVRAVMMFTATVALSGLSMPSAAANPAASAPTAKAATAALPAAVMTAGQAIDPARLEAHVRVLADDKMEGRGTGTRGYDRAAQYVAEQMQAIALRPGGVGG